MAEILFELDQVSYSYLGRFLGLSQIDLKIEQSSKVALIGANGTGKSTLLNMLDALIFPDEGSMKVFGRTITEEVLDDKEFCQFFRSKVGFVFQNPEVQLFSPTVKEEILFGPLQLLKSKQKAKERLEVVVEELKLEELLERAPHQLSIGEKRKVAISSVLAIDPEVLILDEPTAGLDPQTTRDIIDILLKLNHAGKTIITATHDLHIVDEIADTLHVLGKDRRIVRSASCKEVLSDLTFLNEQNLVHIHAHHHHAKAHVHPHSPLERH